MGAGAGVGRVQGSGFGVQGSGSGARWSVRTRGALRKSKIHEDQVEGGAEHSPRRIAEEPEEVQTRDGGQPVSVVTPKSPGDCPADEQCAASRQCPGEQSPCSKTAQGLPRVGPPVVFPYEGPRLRREVLLGGIRADVPRHAPHVFGCIEEHLVRARGPDGVISRDEPQLRKVRRELSASSFHIVSASSRCLRRHRCAWLRRMAHAQTV